MSNSFQPTGGAAIWLMPVGSEVLDIVGVNATWADDDGVTTSAPHGFIAPTQAGDTE